MENINVLIIEDIKYESDLLVEVLVKNNFNIVGIATTFKEALTLFYNSAIDIVIIDVFLNGQPDGINFAETINIVPNTSKPFVFLTSSKDRQIFERAKLTQPFSFLMKPFNELEVLYAIEMAIDKFYGLSDANLNQPELSPKEDDFLFIKKRNSLIKILKKDIIFIEVEERYCSIITKEEKFINQISLKKILEFLDSTIFLRTHRNYIVNTQKIIEVVLADNLIVLEGNYKVLLSDNYKDFINQFRILK